MSKADFAALRGKKVRFKQVQSFPDVKVQFVSAYGDYKVKMASSNAFAGSRIIKVQIVSSFPDVKLQKVNSFPDFEIFME